jgi:hypothetical protein
MVYHYLTFTRLNLYNEPALLFIMIQSLLKLGRKQQSLVRTRKALHNGLALYWWQRLFKHHRINIGLTIVQELYFNINNYCNIPLLCLSLSLSLVPLFCTLCIVLILLPSYLAAPIFDPQNWTEKQLKN